MKNPTRGRVYRRCGCRDADGNQLGARCPTLATRNHGRWTYAVDLTTTTGTRKTQRRGGFSTKHDAQVALGKALEYERTGVAVDDRQTVGEYLVEWLRAKEFLLKPTTMVSYRTYVTKDLVPYLGSIRLEALCHQHVMLFVRDQLAAGRGATTLRRCVATLSSALSTAVAQHRLPHNAARHAVIPRSPKYEPVCWSAGEAARFLRYCADHKEPLANLFELIIGTGMRRGEALGLHWADVHLDERLLFVRYTLSNVNNATPVFTAPKTRSSRAWISLSPRVAAALSNQSSRQRGRDLVFIQPSGKPLRPERVLRRFRALTAAAGLPKIRIHDLRHFAATTMLSAHVPLVMASKTLRHSTVSVTTEVYAHLLRPMANDAVNTIEAALNAADTEAAGRDHKATTCA
ncbi:MAG TPA: tyrosine-type recombinase/integrase [Actinophytocola sp.]|uniref:tyrosine-type recombinase/integrase n=1 Tax=Actinophytocola sp. TaxID=1872138 RepID=UPI002DC0035E|nr:tyrosine-type recombinase/integrase [Actinophytocola sp.]HEU5472706.1 tyrosine-type recombinase/integrase [Actinophytocola sp.]